MRPFAHRSFERLPSRACLHTHLARAVYQDALHPRLSYLCFIFYPPQGLPVCQ